MNSKRLLLQIEDVLEKSTELELSAVLPKVLTLTRLLEDKKFEKWILLESSGYFDTNPAITSDVVVPDYRKVPGQYTDKFGRLIVMDDPILVQATNNYPIREGVAELEHNSKHDGMLSFRNSVAIQLMKETLGLDVEFFSYNASSLKTIISEIRSCLINWLIDKQKEIAGKLYESNVDPNVPLELSGLHPIVQKVSAELYKNGHYRQAILDTYIAVVEAVKVKSGRHGLDNTPLMQNVFSPNNPILRISESTDEQMGFMWLFSGAVMGIRNPKAHRLIEQNDPQRTLEWLSFASVLLRVLDDSQLIN